jgi:hypothetical protein
LLQLASPGFKSLPEGEECLATEGARRGLAPSVARHGPQALNPAGRQDPERAP